MFLRRTNRKKDGKDHRSLQVRLSGLELRRPRLFGNCWLGCEIWRQLGLDEFWQRRLPDGREAVSWAKVLELLVINHLIDPAGEFRVHRQWFLSTAMDELLNIDYAVAEKDRLYRCLDRVLEHKQDLFVWLRGKWADLFQADFEVLLYDLTSTYFEGAVDGRWLILPRYTQPEADARLVLGKLKLALPAQPPPRITADPAIGAAAAAGRQPCFVVKTFP